MFILVDLSVQVLNKETKVACVSSDLLVLYVMAASAIRDVTCENCYERRRHNSVT